MFTHQQDALREQVVLSTLERTKSSLRDENSLLYEKEEEEEREEEKKEAHYLHGVDDERVFRLPPELMAAPVNVA